MLALDLSKISFGDVDAVEVEVFLPKEASFIILALQELDRLPEKYVNTLNFPLTPSIVDCHLDLNFFIGIEKNAIHLSIDLHLNFGQEAGEAPSVLKITLELELSLS